MMRARSGNGYQDRGLSRDTLNNLLETSISEPSLFNSEDRILISADAKLISMVTASIWDAQRAYIEAQSSTVGELLERGAIIAAGQVAAADALAQALRPRD